MTSIMVMLTTEIHPYFSETILRPKMLTDTHDGSNVLYRKCYFPSRTNKVHVCTTINLDKNSCHHPHTHHHLLLNGWLGDMELLIPFIYFRNKPLNLNCHFGGILMNKIFKTAWSLENQPPWACHDVTVMTTSLSALLIIWKLFNSASQQLTSRLWCGQFCGPGADDSSLCHCLWLWTWSDGSGGAVGSLWEDPWNSLELCWTLCLGILGSRHPESCVPNF